MQILAIGNSFSQDASRYLHQIARADGVELNIANLYIGGCSLERHYRNMLADNKAYELQYNGQWTGFFVSLKEALLNRTWDAVTIQQASHFSWDKETYDPYARELLAYIKTCLPKVPVFFHETWGYEDGSARLANLGYETCEAMFADVIHAYHAVHEEIGTAGIIPSGELLLALLKGGIPTIHRDTFHLSLGLGRYAAGLLWYHVLTGRDVAENAFRDFDEPVTEEAIAVIKTCVASFAPIFGK